MVTVVHDEGPNELSIDFYLKNSHLRRRGGGNGLCISDSGVEVIVGTMLWLGEILLNLKSTVSEVQRNPAESKWLILYIVVCFCLYPFRMAKLQNSTKGGLRLMICPQCSDCGLSQ